MAPLLAARERLAELDSDDVVTYHTEWLTVPRSLLRRRVRIPLGREPLPGTWITGDVGQVTPGVLEVDARWLTKGIGVRFDGPSRVVHADEIRDLRARLGSMTDDERRTVEEVEHSRFAHPVLFVSHRWETMDHPDREGARLLDPGMVRVRVHRLVAEGHGGV
ncbi:MAG: hypothetical protein ACRDTA_21580 [Pseudonocardiaceae bacterium]